MGITQDKLVTLPEDNDTVDCWFLCGYHRVPEIEEILTNCGLTRVPHEYTERRYLKREGQYWIQFRGEGEFEGGNEYRKFVEAADELDFILLATRFGHHFYRRSKTTEDNFELQ